MNTADYLVGRGADEATAVVDSTGPYSYRSLRKLVASYVKALDETEAARVALLGPNSVEWVAAYLAILASGRVAVPLPSTLAPDEIVERLSWIKAGAAFLGSQEQKRFGDRIRNPVSLREGDPGQTVESATLSFVSVEQDADAVYAFTSGTTGSPRVVRHTHRNLQANTDSILEYLEITSLDRVLVVLPFSYVFGASVLHTHLRAGATVVIQPNAVFPQSMVEVMSTERCTGFAGVPSTYHVLLRNSTFGSVSLPALSTIQQAGGKLAPALIRELAKAQPQARVFIMYGQTEATARLSFLPPDQLETKPNSIGKGIPGVRLRVVGPDGTPVLPGQIGEIWARGDNISPGYLDDPQETARRIPGGELHTGDLATIDEDGYIYVVDRQEDFIKSWGFRIASQDVESTALQMKDLVSVAVVGVPDEAAGERVELVAVKRPQAAVTVEDVLRHCRMHLAKYQVPSRVHFVPSLPLNANGKISKAAVRELCLGLDES